MQAAMHKCMELDAAGYLVRSQQNTALTFRGEQFETAAMTATITTCINENSENISATTTTTSMKSEIV